MSTVTVLYPQGAKFDLAYYEKTHMPMVLEKWGPFGMKSYKVLQFPEDAPYCIQATLEFGSPKEFQTASGDPVAKEVLGDIPNFSDKQPIILPGKLVTSG